MPAITIGRPGDHELVPVSQPLLVTGTATGKGGTEPAAVDTVTVAVAGVSVKATIKALPFHPGQHAEPEVVFSATVPFPGTFGPVDIIVTATLDNNMKGSKTVTVIGHDVGPPTFTPRESLQVSVVNPPPPSSGDWAAEIVKAYQSPSNLIPSALDLAIWHERGDDYPACEREWNQVLAPANDYDLDTVGFSGWVLEPEISGGDVPFTHPFGRDWECMVALDTEYTGLLAAGNAKNDGAEGDQAREDAAGLNIPVPDGGLLAVETDSGCVPSALTDFGNTVRIGDRIAVFGRWIVDAGHHVELPSGTSYRSEIHPPLLMAIGGTRADPAAGELTRIVVTSRPYLVRQVYTTDTGTIHDDSAPDDGTLLLHLNHEMAKLTKSDIWHAGLPDSTSIEAHPKIASRPFDGVQFFRLSVRAPSGSGGHVGIGPAGQVEVSFQFTCRSGVVVQVLGLNDHVDLLVSLNPVTYHAPELPPRQTDTWTKDRLDALDPDSARLVSFEQVASILTLFQSPFGVIDLVNAEHALAEGIETDKYDVPDVNALDRSHAVPFVSVNQIPAGQGVVTDDNQPYPVFGFIEIRRHHPVVILGG